MKARRAVLALALAGCAGDGVEVSGLEARYPALRALAPHPLGESRPYALAFGGELVLFLCRWPADAAIPVSIGSEAGERQVDALAAALRAWEAPGAGEVAGARIVGASIQLARDDLNPRLTLLHELGHALGFQGHVPRGSTLMLSRHAAVVARAGRVSDASPLEDAALSALYAVPSGAIVARIPVSRSQTLPADRLRAVAAERGLAGPFARMGDREGLLWWAGGVGGRLALRIEGAHGALRNPGLLRLLPASAGSRQILAPDAAAPQGAG